MNDQAQIGSDATSPLLSILSDPNALSGVTGALKKLGILSSEDGDKTEEELSPQPERSGDPSSISALSIDPELMKRIPQLLSVASKLGSAQKRDDNRSRLLLALRPYLSERRRSAIDRLITLGALGDALKSLK